MTEADAVEAASVPYVPYATHVGRFIESRVGGRVETADELWADVAAALTSDHRMATLDYEERYLDIHYPRRLCPACGDIVRIQVVLNRDIDERTRECPDCGVLGTDQHVGPEAREARRVYQRRRRLRKHNDRRRTEPLEVVA